MIFSSLRSQVVAAVVGTVLAATIAALTAARFNGEQAIWQQVEADAELLGAMIAESIALSQEVPDELEKSLERDMVSTARLLAEYVALAKRNRVSQRELQTMLQRLTSELGVSEVWITDSTGRVVYSIPAGVPFTFTPDAKRQPQASAFWPLLTGKASVVAQRTMPRDLDAAPYKYVGVAGVDMPRIVQLGVRQDLVHGLRARLSVERLNGLLLNSGVLHKPLLVVDARLNPVVDATEGATHSNHRAPSERPALTEERRQVLAEVLASGRMVKRMEVDAAVIYRRFASADKRYQGAFAAWLPRDALDDLLQREQKTTVAVGLSVFAVASLLGWLFSRRITARLSTISGVAQGIQRGKFDGLPLLEGYAARQDEVSMLGGVVHSMGNEVRNREAILEQQVRQRTEQLAARNEALTAAQALISGELDMARRLQLGILPASFPALAGYEGAARVRMQQQMGGDFYDFIALPDGRVAVVVADVSGKGVAAAFFMAMTRTSLAQHALNCADPAQCLERVNEDLCRTNPLDLFVTVFLAFVQPGSGEVMHASAGHNPPIHIAANGHAQALPVSGELALGVMAGFPYSSSRLQLLPGDMLLAYTDGVTEAFDEDGEEYGMPRLLQWSSSQAAGTSAAGMVDALFAHVDSFAGQAHQADDITVVAVRRTAQEEH